MILQLSLSYGTVILFKITKKPVHFPVSPILIMTVFVQEKKIPSFSCANWLHRNILVCGLEIFLVHLIKPLIGGSRSRARPYLFLAHCVLSTDRLKSYNQAFVRNSYLDARIAETLSISNLLPWYYLNY